ncbi:MAG: DEAD/DEAH box helicase [bacterium]|nr:DEAD/DEAH box helicase [bacterium]
MNEEITPKVETKASGFNGLGIAPGILEMLAKFGYETPTPIQEQAIPVAMQGKDMVGIAQTGTGKTFAFGIPMIQRLAQIKGRGLVVLPTRELATQVDESLHKIGGPGLRTAVLIGGMAMGPQKGALARDPHIIVATPGRLNDHLQQRLVSLSNVKIVVLDEADRMLDMGFAPQIQKIFNALPAERQTMLFSATMPPEIMTMATKHMKLPIRIEVARSGSTADKVTQEIFIIRKEDKVRLLEKLLQQYIGPVLIFTRTKHGAKRLTRDVADMGHTSAELHSNRSVNQRREALDGFKAGKYRVLIATNIAARGIDVSGIELVVNFDLPSDTDDYVHRIGRTARAGAEGHAISLATPEQRGELRDIERLIQKRLQVSPVPELPPARPTRYVPRDEPRSFRGGGRPSFGGSHAQRGGSRSGGAGRPSFGGALRRPADRPHPGGSFGGARRSPRPRFRR